MNSSILSAFQSNFVTDKIDKSLILLPQEFRINYLDFKTICIPFEFWLLLVLVPLLTSKPTSPKQSLIMGMLQPDNSLFLKAVLQLIMVPVQQPTYSPRTCTYSPLWITPVLGTCTHSNQNEKISGNVFHNIQMTPQLLFSPCLFPKKRKSNYSIHLDLQTQQNSLLSRDLSLILSYIWYYLFPLSASSDKNKIL